MAIVKPWIYSSISGLNERLSPQPASAEDPSISICLNHVDRLTQPRCHATRKERKGKERRVEEVLRTLWLCFTRRHSRQQQTTGVQLGIRSSPHLSRMLKRKNAEDGQHSIANRDGEIDPKYLVPVQLCSWVCVSREW
jgi:hypothetical protein